MTTYWQLSGSPFSRRLFGFVALLSGLTLRDVVRDETIYPTAVTPGGGWEAWDLKYIRSCGIGSLWTTPPRTAAGPSTNLLGSRERRRAVVSSTGFHQKFCVCLRGTIAPGVAY